MATIQIVTTDNSLHIKKAHRGRADAIRCTKSKDIHKRTAKRIALLLFFPFLHAQLLLIDAPKDGSSFLLETGSAEKGMYFPAAALVGASCVAYQQALHSSMVVVENTLPVTTPHSTTLPTFLR
jgi:hypothetical protein